MPTISHEGATLAYQVTGSDGPPVLLIQGIGVVGEGWRGQIGGLGSRYRIMTFDNRGIGASTDSRDARLTIAQMASDALALVDAAGWNSCHVAGHSMGGVIAQEVALRAPERVRSLGLLCTVAEGKQAVRLTPRTAWLGLRTRIGTRRSRRRAFLSMIFAPGSLRGRDIDRVAREMEPFFGRDLAEQPPIVMRQALAMRAHRRGDLSLLHKIPVLVLSAQHDVLTPPRRGRRLASLIPGSRFVQIDRAAHGVIIERADDVNRILDEFWTGAEDRLRTEHGLIH